MGTENVKERLNTLLHKKITEQEKDCKTSPVTAEPAVSIKSEAEIIDRNGRKVQQHQPQIDSPEFQQDGSSECTTIKDQIKKTFLLHEVLSEKRKTLLQDKEVIAFFQNNKFK